MISRQDALRFAGEWIEAWNSHDLDRILSHYDDDLEMTTPFIVMTMNEPSGTLKGKQKVGEYWRRALERVPDLHFDLIEVYSSVNSLTITYRGVFGRPAAETLIFGGNGKVLRAIAHYGE